VDGPETWRWIWLIGAAALGVGEMATTGFFLLPFALGGLTAAVLAFAGLDLAWELAGFAVVSGVTFSMFRPVARRLDEQGITEGIGAKRLIGQPATVVVAIEGDGTGRIRVDREEWRADSADGSTIPAGALVTVLEIRGTRAIVSARPQGASP
jgi:membrane protein implicated in regulation of membrane protease activity